MLDEKDLQAIAQLMVQQRQSIMEDVEKLMDEKLAQQKAEIMHEVGALIEADVIPKFNLLADGQKLIQEKLTSAEEMEDIHTQLDVLEAISRRNVREIEKLKKAQ